MKNINFKTIISVTVFAFAGLSCAKKDPVGPSINGLYGPVVVVEPLINSNASPDFSSNNQIVTFSAKFENETNWVLTIKGDVSGATKTISGTSRELNANNTVWNGGADDLPSFQKESVTAWLTFKNGYKDSLDTKLAIAGTRNLDKDAIIISAFKALDTRWERDWQTITTGDGSYPKPDGNNYLTMTGTPWQGSPITPYVNYLLIKPQYSDTSTNTTGFYKLIQDPNKVYFNLMVYATSTKDAWLQIMFSEEQGINRTLEIKPDWVGWKLVTCRYSDLKVPDDKKGVAATPHRIKFVQFTLLSSSGDLAAKQTVKTSFDHATFTIDHPYKP